MAKNIFKKIKIYHILIFTFIVRFILLPWTFHGDITVTYWWGQFTSEFGFRGFYDWINFGGYGRPDQPMLNIFYIEGVRQIYSLLHSFFWFLNVNIPIFPSKFMEWFFLNGNQILLKFPMIIFDILIIYTSFKFIKIQFNEKKAKIIAIILTFYPPMIYNSSVWGSGDSIVNFFALLSVYFAWQKKYIYSSLFFIISVLYKPSLLIWAPILLVCFLKNKIKIRELMVTIFFSLSCISLISFPFNPVEINPLIWFYQTMTTKILPGAMPQITANAMNIWALIYGLLPQRLDKSLIFNLISHRQFSLIICSIFYLIICFKLYKKYTIQNLLLSLVNITLITFMFMTRMHERYTFPALIPLLMLCFYDKKFIKYFFILSITHLLNVYNWWWIPNIKPLIFILKQDFFVRLISLTNLLITLKIFSFNFKNKSLCSK
ncbi:MAG: hypothetical protein PHE32_02575 [Candidatus Shapirobacteria bacterium]|nr:hypothetical protein [Candidatus Shapirobacteria bacterium]MDD4410557.1 hypothetical protein [Candidatus Shapirobacteria bacterium]